MRSREAYPSFHEGPQWLVVVQAGRLDDRDILFTGPPQPGGDANARGAASANHDPMAHRSAFPGPRRLMLTYLVNINLREVGGFKGSAQHLVTQH